MTRDAAQVAQDLGIPYYVVDFQEEFSRHVMDYFSAEYLAGRTRIPAWCATGM